MADTVKCALFVDYDSIYRRLSGANPEAAGRLAQKVGAWVGGIESGSLVAPARGDDVRRRILIRRCYASPETLASGRAAFVASGFEVVDCPVQDGRDRSAADIHIVLDTIAALDHPAGYEEFILLSADADLTPVLLRLRAHARTTVIYANEATAATYRAIADGMVEEAALIALVNRDETAQPAPAEAPAAAGAAPTPPPAQPGDRSQIEALARKVHAATNVPLFSPRTYADLFRYIAQEIAERGYHFQNTAENVTEKLVAAGRNVNRRQVLFVVKGLALKGHVFSTTDTPERLAEVFREQVLYLVGNTELKLEAAEAALLSSWIIGRVTAAQAASEAPPDKSAAPAAGKLAKRKPAKAAPEKAAAPAPPPPAAARAAPREAAPAPAGAIAAKPAGSPPVRDVPPPSAAKPPAVEAEAEEPAPPPRPAARKLDEIRAAAAARLAALGRPAGAQTPAAARPAPPPKPAAQAAKPAEAKPVEPAKPARAKPPAAEENQDALETSILAAIAQAVDVLVEDSGGTHSEDDEAAPPAPPATPAPPPAAATPAAPPEEPVPSDGGDSDDIGDEIQRIIASYSRARQQGEPR
jgi:hypothetical protein